MITILTMLACGTRDAGPTPADPHAGVDFASVESCSACHADAVAEWKQSMHARAHADEDPVYAAMLALRTERQGPGVARKCANCHNPLDPEDPNGAAGRLGVACGACHTAEELTSPAVGDGRTVCVSCHGVVANPAGVATCTTGAENEFVGSAACVGCHMPTKGGRRQHTFNGPHRAWLQDDPALLASAVAVVLTRGGDTVDVSVTNTTGHAFPTGFPGRVARLRLIAGEWSAEPDELVFRKVYVGADGKPTLPPFATELQLDTRLKPGETRHLVVPVPPSVTSEVRAELEFALLPPAAVAILGLEGRPEAEPVRVPFPAP